MAMDVEVKEEANASDKKAEPAEARVNKDEIDILFHMLSIFGTRTLVDLSFLKNFYLITVAKTYTVQQKRQILKHFLVFFKETTHTQEHKARALQLLIVPMLTECFQKKSEAAELVSSELVATVVKQLLEYKASDPMYDESLSIELLNLATAMIQHIPNELIDHRKELIKFAWSHLKSEDTVGKLCAYVNVCRFIEVYETPSKIILQVYVALLRTFQPEAKALVKEALDILTPALPKRLPPAENHKYPSWIKWTKKIIVEEGHSLSQLIHIWQLLVRHPQLFYNCRAQFVPQMVNSLTRIGSAPKCPVENVKLTVDLAQLIIKWDTRCIETQGAGGSRYGSGRDRRNPSGSYQPKASRSRGGEHELGRERKRARGSDGSPLTSDAMDVRIPPEVLALTGPDDHFRPSQGNSLYREVPF